MKPLVDILPRPFAGSLYFIFILLFFYPLSSRAAVIGGPEGPIIDSADILITGQVINRTCFFSQANYYFDLDTIFASQFTTGAVMKQREVDLILNCGDRATAIKLFIEGVPDEVNANLFKNLATENNVGLRLEDDSGNLLTPSGIDFVSRAVENQTATFKFKAGYQATGKDKVESGRFSSSVTMIIIYE